jgi:hypothetical protein
MSNSKQHRSKINIELDEKQLKEFILTYYNQPFFIRIVLDFVSIMPGIPPK